VQTIITIAIFLSLFNDTISEFKLLQVINGLLVVRRATVKKRTTAFTTACNCCTPTVSYS